MSLDSLLASYDNDNKQKQTFVTTQDFKDWLYHYINRQPTHTITDDDGYFEHHVEKSEYVDYLSFFIVYVVGLSKEQRVLNVPDEHNPFETINFVIKLKDKYYELKQYQKNEQVITMMSQVDQPLFNYVLIPEELPEPMF